jgi:hypothetical protein
MPPVFIGVNDSLMEGACTLQALMYRLLLMILLSAQILFAAEKVDVSTDPIDDRTGICPIFCLLIGETTSPQTGMYLVRTNFSPPNWIYTSSALGADSWRPILVRRSATGLVIVGMIADMMAVALPVQRFINTYSTYDTGTNRYSQSIVHLQTHVNRGSVWVSAQLRL